MPMSLRNAVSRSVTSSSAKFTNALTAGKTYRIVGDVDFWYKLAATGGSVAASDATAIFVPAGQVVYDTPVDELFLHVIRAAVDGTVNLAEVNGAV